MSLLGKSLLGKNLGAGFAAVLSATVVILGTSAQAQIEVANVADINKNYAEAMFMFDMGFHTGLSSASDIQYEVNPNVEGFMTEDLTFGGIGQIAKMDSKNGGSYFGIGPSASWYFLRKSNWIAKAGAGLLFRRIDVEEETEQGRGNFVRNDVILRPMVSLKYHITPEFAVGPEFSIDTTLSGPRTEAIDEKASLLVGLEVLL